jgi:hypothetical protein
VDNIDDTMRQRPHRHIEIAWHDMQHRIGTQVLVLGVPTPQGSGCDDGDEAVHVRDAVCCAAAVLAAPAFLA